MSTAQQKTSPWFLVLGILLVGATLRVPLTSVGALIPFIRTDLGISNTLAGSITTLPLIAFALLSPFAPKIARRIGIQKTIAAALVVLILGIAIRSSAGTYALFAGTFFIGLAIAVGNVLIPAVVKLNFPLKVGLITGLYAVTMNLFGALGSGLSVPIANAGLAWKGSLAIWAALVLLALLLWLPQLKNKRPPQQAPADNTSSNTSLWRSPLAWSITFFMGLQSLVFYTLITWLPDILRTKGYDETAAGWLVFLMQFALIPVTFIVPIIAEKMTNQIKLSATVAILFSVGLLGLLTDNTTFYPLWVIFLGVAGGTAFSLSMMFFTLRTQNAREAANLSGMAQSFGYLLAAIGPTLVGALQDISNGWTLPIIILISLSMLLLLNGVVAGQNRHV